MGKLFYTTLGKSGNDLDKRDWWYIDNFLALLLTKYFPIKYLEFNIFPKYKNEVAGLCNYDSGFAHRKCYKDRHVPNLA